MTTPPDAPLPPPLAELLAFWLGDVGDDGRVDEAHRLAWFRKSDAFDAEVRARFAALHDDVARGVYDDALAAPRGRLALLIVLDQLPRNMFRGSPRSFASDARARAIAEEGLARGDDAQVRGDARMFFYLPLMHAEDVGAQEEAVRRYEAWARTARDDGERAGIEQGVRFARAHLDIVRRFGRFPHRNAILGRPSTEEERAFLQTPGSSF